MRSAIQRLAVVASIATLVAISVGLTDTAVANGSPAIHARGTRSNLPARPDYMTPCVLEGPQSRACITRSIAALENARAHESMRKRKVILPRNYTSLTRAEQTFVVINLERVDRGIPPIIGMTARLNRQAKAGAIAGADPTPLISVLQRLGVGRYKTLWAQDYGALASDYEWMYNDGYAGRSTTNIACGFASAQGCWDHRRAMLNPFRGFPLLLGGMGVANAIGRADSLAVVLTGGHGRAPHFTYTWRNALRHGADGHRIR